MRRTMIGISTMTVLLALVLIGVQQRGPRPRTAHEAVSVVLQQRAIAFEDVRVENGRCLPTPEQCSEYRADVVVVGRNPLRGLMQCWRIDRDCEFWVADLDLNTSLPDLAPPAAWLGEIERLARAAARWMHEALSRSLCILTNAVGWSSCNQ